MNRRNFLLSSAMVALQSKSSPASDLFQNSSTMTGESVKDQLAHDPLRPQFHLLPQAGFVGDPCAPLFFRGNYHVFFHGSFGGRGWQHAVSSDLVHWRHLPIALSPMEGSYDAYGTFTGGVLPGGDGASVIYTGVTKVPRNQETIRAEGLREVQCIATSMDDELRTWRKRDHPVILLPPTGLQVTGFRDPFAWKEGNTWYLCIGSGFPQIGGAVLLYRSTDTVTWEYLHPLSQGTWNGMSFSNPVPSGEMWECPDFFPLGNKHVLLYSTEHTTRWEVGTFDRRDLRFRSEKQGILDQGAYYAPRSMSDDKGRRILWGWVQETRDQSLIHAAGWSGSISLPRLLTLSEDSVLQMEVAPELSSLRANTVEIRNPTTAAEIDDSLSRAAISNRSGEITCSFRANESPCSLELRLQTAAGTSPMVTVAYSRANDAPFVAIGDRLIPLFPGRGGLSMLHIWIDASVIEIFIDKRQAITTRYYASPDEVGEIRLVWNGVPTSLESMTVSQIKAISADRLTT